MSPTRKERRPHHPRNPTRSRACRALLAVGFLMLGPPAAGQSISGWLDFVDQDSILGWACYQGDASTKISVDLWAWDYGASRWLLISRARADKERLDVGGSGICGTGLEARYHGFEHTIYPDALLKEGSNYYVAAYVRDASGYRPLNGSRTVGFSARGFPTSNVWRTDYDDPNATSVAMVSCIWPFKGANAREDENTDHPDPLFLYAGPTQRDNYCIRNDPDDPASWDWSRSNSATNASSWPRSNFWVVSANSEPAYSKTQSGPPSQSEPIGGHYSVSMWSASFELGIDNSRSGYAPGDTPFLSLGAEMGRGVAGPIDWLQPGQETYLELEVKQVQRSPGHYHDIYAIVELMWGNYKRFLAVSLVNPTRSRFHWNWNALSSFWFPGGEFNYLGTQGLASLCSLQGAQLPVAGDANVGVWLDVRIPIDGVLDCLERVNIPNQHDQGRAGGFLGWSYPRPQTIPIAITGVHLAIEQAPGQPTASMKVRFTKPRLVDGP